MGSREECAPSWENTCRTEWRGLPVAPPRDFLVIVMQQKRGKQNLKSAPNPHCHPRARACARAAGSESAQARPSRRSEAAGAQQLKEAQPAPPGAGGRLGSSGPDRAPAPSAGHRGPPRRPFLLASRSPAPFCARRGPAPPSSRSRLGGWLWLCSSPKSVFQAALSLCPPASDGPVSQDLEEAGSDQPCLFLMC